MSEIKRIFIACPKCGANCQVTPLEYEPSLGSFKCESCGIYGTTIEKHVSELRRLREENERLKEELSALTNPSDARCMEIGMLREQREKLQTQVERLKDALKNVRSDAVDAAGIKE